MWGTLPYSGLTGYPFKMTSTLIQPRLTCHFSRIHSPRFVTLIPVLSMAGNNILGEILGCHFERKLQGFDPTKEGGIICRLKTGMNGASSRTNPSIWR